MKRKTVLLLVLGVVFVFLIVGSAVGRPASSMSGNVVMAWGPADVRNVSFEAGGHLDDGIGWVHIEWGAGIYVDYEVTHFNLIDKKLAACWGTLTDTNSSGWGLSEIVIWARDTGKGYKEQIAWIWSNVTYNPAYLTALYWEFDPGYGTTPTLSEPLSGHLKVK